MISQKEAVYQATMAVLEQRGIKFQDGTNIRETIKNNSEIRSQIRELVTEGIQSGAVPLTQGRSVNVARREDERSARAYATGLISNWFRKDRRLNGGERYVPASFRDGSKHSQKQGNKLDTLRAALNIIDDPSLKDQLEHTIKDLEDEEGSLAYKVGHKTLPHGGAMETSTGGNVFRNMLNKKTA